MIRAKDGYVPTRGDRRFRDAKLGDGPKPDDFETARLLRGVSHEYLSVLAASNSGETSKPFRVQLEAEVARRNAQRATRLAIGSLAVAVVSLLISGTGLLHTYAGSPKSNAPPPHPQITALRPPIVSNPAQPLGVKYPQYVTNIPAAFRGRWDEIVADKCAAREARFKIDASSLANFEVVQDVERVKLYSPTEIAITTSFYDNDKNEQNGTWEFKLVDAGRTLTGRKAGAFLFHRCPGE